MQTLSSGPARRNHRGVISNIPHVALLLATIALSACNTVKQQDEGEKPSSIPHLDERAKLNNELKKILAILQIDMGIDGSLRNLTAIEKYIKEKLQKNGHAQVDVYVEIALATNIDENGEFPLFTVVVGTRGKDNLATSSQLKTEDENTNTWFREQFCRNFITTLVPPLEAAICLCVENDVDEEDRHEMLGLFFQKYQTQFRQHGILLISYKLVVDDDSGSHVLILKHINPITGKHEMIKVKLGTKEKLLPDTLTV